MGRPRAFELSERYEIPVILRPTTRVCHARQDLERAPFRRLRFGRRFSKRTRRVGPQPPSSGFCCTTSSMKRLPRSPPTQRFAPRLVEGDLDWWRSRLATSALRGGIWSGAGACRGDPGRSGLAETDPALSGADALSLAPAFRDEILPRHDRILVLEESLPVIEWQLQNRDKVFGRTTGTVPEAGELLPEVVEDLLRDFLGLEPAVRPSSPAAAGRRPTLCAGCPHRSSFFAIKKAFPKGIYPSDIGCYTLGLNLGVVDTVLCMGAAISQAAGFYHAYQGLARGLSQHRCDHR